VHSDNQDERRATVEVDEGHRAGVSTDERDRIKALEKEVKELRKANDILKTASAFFAQAELDRKLK
jgi:transposase